MANKKKRSKTKRVNRVRVSALIPKGIAQVLEDAYGGFQPWVDAHVQALVDESTEAVIIKAKPKEISPEDF